MSRRWYWVVQALVFLLVAAFVARSLSRNWAEFESLHFDLRLDLRWLGLSVLAVVLTSAIQIESWRRILAGWSQTLGYADAARIWFLANVGRYIPGKVWSVAGMVVLAQRRGVAAWSATASAVAVQAIGIGTAVALIVATATAAGSLRSLVLATLVALGTIGGLAWEFATARIARVVPKMDQLRPLPLGALVLATLLTLGSWLTYGVSFWALSRGLGQPHTLGLAPAAGIFAAGYILGLIALFAPGGVGIREGVFLALLTPALGAGGAIALSLASRVVLTLVEALAGLGALLIRGPSKEISVESPSR